MNKIYSLKYSYITGGLIAVSELCKNVKKGSKTNTLLTLAIAGIMPAVLSAPAFSAIVRNDIPYQTFRDFAENKGDFNAGNTNIAIKNNSGTIIGYLDKAPMPDFSSASVYAELMAPGAHTLYSPEYMVTANHVDGVENAASKVSFGYTKNNYFSVATKSSPNTDIKTLRLNKLVTEVAPAEVSTSGTQNGAYNTGGKYSVFYRLGGGDKYTQNTSGQRTKVNGSFLLGGTVGHLWSYNGGRMINTSSAQIFNSNSQGILANYLIMGDSGSPLFGFNTETNKWELVAVTVSMTTDGNQWAVASKDFLKQQPTGDFANFIDANKEVNPFKWSYDVKSGIGKITGEFGYYTMRGIKNNDLNAGKNIYLTGDDGKIELVNNVTQGAGYLHFAGNYSISTENNSTWTGGGILVEEGKTVNWGINGVSGDNLHKVGAGTLVINGTGENNGGLKIGDGLVVLNQQADANNKVQAASSLNISSGRAIVQLADKNQINPDNISWGYRGGNLDLNGTDITFTKLNAADYGAIISNSSMEKSTVTLNLQTLKPEDISVNIKNIDFRGGTGNPGDLFYDADMKRYVILHKSSYAPLFLDRNNKNIWTDAGTDKTAAINLVKSMKIASSSKPYLYHGQLIGNINADIPSLAGDDVITFDGAINIDGNMKKNGGMIIFQGHPFLHAGKSVSASQTDWETRQFSLNELYLTNSDFHLSRNADMSGDIIATDKSAVTLGSDKVYIDKNDGTGNGIDSVAGTSQPQSDSDISSFSGVVQSDNSAIILNNRFSGKIAASNNSTVTINSSDVTFNTGASISQDSILRLNEGAKVTAPGWVVNKGKIDIEKNANLILQGYPVYQSFVPTYHDIGNVSMNGDGATLTAGDYAMFSGDIVAAENTSIKLNLGSDNSTLSELTPDPELATLMFDKYNTSWTGSISAPSGEASMVNTVWRMTNDSKLNKINADNSLTVFSSDNNKFSTLTVNELTTNNSTFVMRSGKNNSDKLIVNNKLDGKNNNLLVDYVENDGKEKALNHILISAPKGTATDIFNAQTQTVGFSDVTPIIEEKTSDENTTWILKGFNSVENRTAAQKAGNFMSAGYKNFLAEVNNLNKRMGDLRDINGEAGAWARIMSGAGSAGGGYSDNYTHVQIGADKKHELDGLDLFTGLTMTYTDSHAGSHDFSGET
ncbi:TPA: autotransporter outer membrane beta-barrel domain-containing protein, partial [Escherichia coli]|nr:autotransporter outer membrane beta-barrel domain-containing protein [Escherichia coli]HDW3968474.1 autotransporter outer membrane beta-barrel domain-containing protein [Escherichia coli]